MKKKNGKVNSQSKAHIHLTPVTASVDDQGTQPKGRGGLETCRHVLDVHRQAGMQRAEEDGEAAQEEQFLRRYIEYCRARVSPRLSDAAAATLASEYVELREEVCPRRKK